MKRVLLLTTLLLSVSANAGIFSDAKCYLTDAETIQNQVSDNVSELDLSFENLSSLQTYGSFVVYLEQLEQTVEQLTFAVSCLKSKKELEEEKGDLINSVEEATEIASQLLEIQASRNKIRRLAEALNTLDNIRKKLGLNPVINIEVTRF